MLADLRVIFAHAAKLHTATVLDQLRALEDSPWADLTRHQLSKMLRTYGIRPKSVRETGTGPSLRGYQRADLADAFTRYLPPESPTEQADAEPGDDPPPEADDESNVVYVVDTSRASTASTKPLTCDVVDVGGCGGSTATTGPEHQRAPHAARSDAARRPARIGPLSRPQPLRRIQ